MKLILLNFVAILASSFSNAFANDNNKFEGWSVEALTGSMISKATLGQILYNGSAYPKSSYYLEDTSSSSTPIKFNLIYFHFLLKPIYFL